MHTADGRSPRLPELGGVALGVALVSVPLIGYFVWFPFDFVHDGTSIRDVVRRFSVTTGPIWNLREAPANLLLFLPLGFGIGGLARVRGSSKAAAVVIGAVLAALLSTLIEVVQSAWLLREPALDDIIANTLGAALGGCLWGWLEPTVARASCRVRHTARSRRGRVAWFALSLLPPVLVTVALAASADATELSSWSPSYPLVLGNEATGDRPWSGHVAAISIAARALGPTQTSALLSGQRMRDVAPGDVVLDLDFTTPGPLPAGLRAVGDGSAGSGPTITDGGLDLDPAGWVISTDAAATASERVAASGEFTALLDVTTRSMDQEGPARILTVSPDPFSRNLTVAQDGADLVVRVRSRFAGRNGASPEFVVPGAFGTGGRHVFVVVYDAAGVDVAIDRSSSTHSMALFPATVPMVERFTDEITQVRTSRLGDAARDSYRAASMFAPWTVCSVLLARRRVARGRRHVIHAGLVVQIAVLVPIVECAVWVATPGQASRLWGSTAAAAVITAVTAAVAVTVVGARQQHVDPGGEA